MHWSCCVTSSRGMAQNKSCPWVVLNVYPSSVVSNVSVVSSRLRRNGRWRWGHVLLRAPECFSASIVARRRSSTATSRAKPSCLSSVFSKGQGIACGLLVGHGPRQSRWCELGDADGVRRLHSSRQSCAASTKRLENSCMPCFFPCFITPVRLSSKPRMVYCRIGCSITKGTHDTRRTRHANPCTLWCGVES